MRNTNKQTRKEPKHTKTILTCLNGVSDSNIHVFLLLVSAIRSPLLLTSELLLPDARFNSVRNLDILQVCLGLTDLVLGLFLAFGLALQN